MIALDDLRQQLLLGEYAAHQKGLEKGFDRAKSASRLIIPLAVVEWLTSVGADAYLPSGIRSASAYPFIVLSISVFGVLALGFFAMAEAQGLVYQYARLAQLEMRLGLGVRGFYLRDFVEHAGQWTGANRLEQLGSRVAAWIVGVRVRNPFVLATAAVVVWTAVAGEGVCLAFWYVNPGELSLLAAVFAGPVVLLMLVAASRAFVGSLPVSLKQMLRSRDWVRQYQDALGGEANDGPPELRLKPMDRAPEEPRRESGVPDDERRQGATPREATPPP